VNLLFCSQLVKNIVIHKLRSLNAGLDGHVRFFAFE